MKIRREYMPVVTVMLLPKMSEERLRKLHQKIVKAMVRLGAPNITREESFFTLFPGDQMQYGLGSEVVVKVENLLESPGISDNALEELTKALSKEFAAILRSTIPSVKTVMSVIKMVHPSTKTSHTWSWVNRF